MNEDRLHVVRRNDNTWIIAYPIYDRHGVLQKYKDTFGREWGEFSNDKIICNIDPDNLDIRPEYYGNVVLTRSQIRKLI